LMLALKSKSKMIDQSRDPCPNIMQNGK